MLTIEHSPGAIEVVATRTASVPDAFWLKLQSEWGTDGRRPRESVDVGVSTFLERLHWLPKFCRKYRVELEWRGNAKNLVSGRQLVRRSLREALEPRDLVDSEELLDTITAQRYRRDLRPFQVRDLVSLASIAHGANFSVPGAGKTSVAYALHEYLRSTQGIHQMLVVAPVSAFESWETEAIECLVPSPAIQRFQGSIASGTQVLLVSYQRLESGYAQLADWLASRASHMILDEAHRMKRGWAGAWGRNCLNLAYLATRRDILTGTPAPQSLDDLYALLEFLWPGSSNVLLPSEVTTADEASIVSNRISPLYSRTTKSELDLPAPQIHLHKQALGTLHGEIYAALLGIYRGSFGLSRRAQFDMRSLGAVTMYLLEAATNPSLLVAGSHPSDPISFRHPPLEIPIEADLDELLRSYPSYEMPWKFEYIKKTVGRNASLGRKTLVWSNFVRNLETLRQFELSEFAPAIVHGGVIDRDAQIAKFRADVDCSVLLANPAATSEGISLHHECHDAVYLERTFNAGQYLQSLDRIHRLGLEPETETHITVLCSDSTIDEVVDDRVRQKTERLSLLLQDPGLIVMALPAIPEEGLMGKVDLGLEDADAIGLRAHIGIE